MSKFLTGAFVKATAWGMARHALTTAGGAMIADGYMTSDQMNGLIGSGFFLFGIAWSVYDKHMKTKGTK